MILVLVGTNFFSFDRLVEEVDLKIAETHEVVMQIGVTKYIPVNAKSFKFKRKDFILEQIKKSDLVITHGGYGSMMDSILLGKRVIAVPRKLEYKECLDNQMELVQYFESKKYVVGCYDINNLQYLVEQCLDGKFSFFKYKAESNNRIKDLIGQELKNYLSL